MTRREWFIAPIVLVIVAACVFVVWQRPFDHDAATAPKPAPVHVIDDEPKPEYSPQQVVRIIVDALRHNNAPEPDGGIATTFRFASPANREITGWRM